MILMFTPHIGTAPYYISEGEILEEISVRFNLGILHPAEPTHYIKHDLALS